MPLLAREQLLMDLIALLCDYAASSDDASENHAHRHFEPRPGYVYGMDGTAQFKERSPDVPPVVKSLIIVLTHTLWCGKVEAAT